jgi:predicted NodU family carbamoyl transferase
MRLTRPPKRSPTKSGRVEFGQRPVGARPIPGDGRSPAMQKNLNLRSSIASAFVLSRPLCCREDLADGFDLKSGSPPEGRRRQMSWMNRLFRIDSPNVS